MKVQIVNYINNLLEDWNSNQGTENLFAKALDTPQSN